jgi:hypothetical protein
MQLLIRYDKAAKFTEFVNLTTLLNCIFYVLSVGWLGANDEME